MSSAKTEKKAFITRLQSDPAFLVDHAGTLSSAIFSKLTNQLRLRLFPRHRGTKVWPEWLHRHRRSIGRNKLHFPIGGATNLYDLRPCVQDTPLRGQQAGAPVWDDPEDRFAAHRWYFLLDQILDSRAQWRAGVEKAVEWIRQHKDKSDQIWEPYSSCERLANLLVFLAAKAPDLGDDIAEITEFIADSTEWIYRHVEYYGPARTNNHILNNARALVMAGAAMSDEEIMNIGVMIFRRCLPELVLGNGFLRERSSHYHLIVLNWVLDAARFVAASEVSSKEDVRFLESYAGQMASAARLLCEDGVRLTALVGDVSPDITPERTFARLESLYPEIWKSAADAIPEGARDGWFRVTVDKGVIFGNFPPGPFPPAFPTHGHFDLTSFTWSNAGREILVDSGRYRYTPDRISQFQVSPEGHNVPLVNGFSPLSTSLVARGSWWPLPYACATLDISEAEGGIRLSHDGFARATPVRHHTRRISLENSGLRVVDEFEGSGAVELQFCWHFGAGFDAFDEAALVASGPQWHVKLKVEGLLGQPSAQPISGAAPGGWTSKWYGEVQPSVAIGLRSEARLPAKVTTLFSLNSCAE